jgi:hypothetical protein
MASGDGAATPPAPEDAAATPAPDAPTEVAVAPAPGEELLVPPADADDDGLVGLPPLTIAPVTAPPDAAEEPTGADGGMEAVDAPDDGADAPWQAAVASMLLLGNLVGLLLWRLGAPGAERR